MNLNEAKKVALKAKKKYKKEYKKMCNEEQDIDSTSSWKQIIIEILIVIAISIGMYLFSWNIVRIQ